MEWLPILVNVVNFNYRTKINAFFSSIYLILSVHVNVLFLTEEGKECL